MNDNVARKIKKKFRHSKAHIETMTIKFDQPETTELFVLTCIRALKFKQDITIRFTTAAPTKEPNFSVKWKKCKPYPDPGQPEYEDCCGVCVEWECRKDLAT